MKNPPKVPLEPIYDEIYFQGLEFLEEGSEIPQINGTATIECGCEECLALSK